MEEVREMEIPCYFVCPISMQLMRDPVTVSTGITYDRENIERWLSLCKNATCPVTKQVLSNTDLTPNHNLRRLIQEWCTFNAYDRIPTPKAPVEKSHILKLLKEARDSPKSQINCLLRLRSIADRDSRSRTHLQQAPGAVDFLVETVKKKEDIMCRNEALSILNQIQLSESDANKLLSDINGGFLENENCRSREDAVTLLRSAFHVADPELLIGSSPEIYSQVVRVLKDKISAQATKAALKLLVELCPWGRNRIKAVEKGAVSALVELLLETGERRTCDLVMTVLDQLCGCAEGRAELLAHGAGLAVVSKKILRVSNAASDRAVRIVGSISKHSANYKVLHEMMQVGVVSKLCLVLQVDCSQKTKERANEILRMHSRVWRDSSCIPPHLLSSYPTKLVIDRND